MLRMAASKDLSIRIKQLELEPRRIRSAGGKLTTLDTAIWKLSQQTRPKLYFPVLLRVDEDVGERAKRLLLVLMPKLHAADRVSVSIIEDRLL